MPWSDKQLRAHKKASAGLSVATSTLGIGALGVAGARAGAGRGLKLAQKAGRLKNVTPAHVKHFKAKSTGVQTGLLTASAGLGGISGFNFAGIQSAEAKRSSKVAKREKFRTTEAQDRQIRRASHKGDAIGTAAGVGASLAFPAVRRSVAGSAKLSRALYQGSKASSGGLRAIGEKPSMSGRLRKVQSNVRAGASAAGKGASMGPLYVMEKHPKQALGALGTIGVGSQTGAQVGHSRKRGELKRQAGYKTAFIKSDSGDLDMGLGFVRHGEIAKAYDPERKRAKRMDRYQTGASTAAGALGMASAHYGIQTGKGVRHTVKHLKRGGTIGSATTDVLGRGGLKTVGLGAGAIGAAVAADRIKSYKRGNGRTYRPLHAQI